MADSLLEERRDVRVEGIPPGLQNRLRALRLLCVTERDADARARLAREKPQVQRAFADLVAARLRELRALQDLAAHLHSTKAQASPCPGAERRRFDPTTGRSED